MGEKKAEVSFEGTMTIEKVLSYLEELTASIRAGSIRVEKGGEQVVLHPTEVVRLEVKAKTKKDKQSFQLELSWEGGGLEIGRG
ncbi:amphi-Trp domain-containing protein [Nannocystaceae bacterium ST9]